MNLVWIVVAGAAGCVARFLMEYTVRRHHPTRRPWATVTANVFGCALAGWAVYRLIGTHDTQLRSIVVTGFCGGLTTFSSALAIPAILQREHHWGYAAALVLTTPLLCAGGFVTGMSLAHVF